MSIQCKETIVYNKATELLKTYIKGIDNVVTYYKTYLDKTNDYIAKIQNLNVKYKNNFIITPVDEYFYQLRSVIQGQINSYLPVMTLIEKNIDDIEKMKQDCLECQKKLQEDYIKTADDFIFHLKDTEKIKRQYHSDAVSLETLLRNFSKKQRKNKKQSDEEENPEILKAMLNMENSEKEYIKKQSRGKMFVENFINRIGSVSLGIQNLLQLLVNQIQERVFFTMLTMQNSGKEIVSDIDNFIRITNKVSTVVINDLTENEKEPLYNLKYEPYKIKSLLKEYQEDFTETELHYIIKRLAQTMIKKPKEVIIIFNSLV